MSPSGVSLRGRIGLVAVVAVVFLLLTELTSNTATATMGMPLMAGVAAGVISSLAYALLLAVF